MKKYAVIVAGGSGSRMGSAIPKQFLLLKGKPLLWYSITVFVKTFPDIHVVLVLPEEHISRGEALAADLPATNPIRIVKGGDTRFHSVQNGLALVKGSSVIFVHDGVRCLATESLLQRCYEQALEKGSAIPAVTATDSIRLVHANGSEVANRNEVRIIQTPQTFRSELLVPAFTTTYHHAFTDEATVVEASGKTVFLVEGEYENIKITRPADLLVAETILAGRDSSL